MWVQEMYLLLGLIAAQHCNDIGIVSDSSLARAMEMTKGVTVTEEQLAVIADEVQKNGLPNATQCTGFERLLSSGVPGA